MNRAAGFGALAWPATSAATSTVPAPAGLTAVQLVAIVQTTFVAGALPKRMLVPPGSVLKLTPAIVTAVPPDVGPPDGDTAVTAGTIATAVETLR